MPKTLLCVDDDPEIRELIQKFFEKQGFRVVTSVDGWDAMREIIVKKPDIVLLDINMPKLDGLSALDMIKVARLDHQIPILLVSGEGDKETITRAAKLGADDFVVKPFSFEELSKRVAQQLFSVDGVRLKEILKGLQLAKKVDIIPGFELAKHPNYNAFTGDHEGCELCVLVRKEITIQQAFGLSDALARSQVQVYQRLKSGWRAVWPKKDMIAFRAA